MLLACPWAAEKSAAGGRGQLLKSLTQPASNQSHKHLECVYQSSNDARNAYTNDLRLVRCLRVAGKWVFNRRCGCPDRPGQVLIGCRYLLTIDNDMVWTHGRDEFQCEQCKGTITPFGKPVTRPVTAMVAQEMIARHSPGHPWTYAYV